MKIEMKVFSLYYQNRAGWLRGFGKGIAWKDTRIHRLTFSQRNGVQKCWQIGNWNFGLLV